MADQSREEKRAQSALANAWDAGLMAGLEVEDSQSLDLPARRELSKRTNPYKQNNKIGGCTIRQCTHTK